MNLLHPKGQFGSRAMGGKDAASPRYITTYLSPLTRALYPEPDDHCLRYLDDDGKLVEPNHYVPIIPLILVNGADGIGSGWSTSIPPFNPIDIIMNLRKKLRGEEMTRMHPYYKGWTGDVLQTGT